MKLLKSLFDWANKKLAHHKELRMFDAIVSDFCPKCKAKSSMFLVARGGVAMNVECANCHARYWMSPIRDFGAKEIRQ